MTAPIVISLGSINLDLQVRADRWPGPGETLMCRDLLRVGGGKAANRAVIAHRLGADAALLGRVGDDDFGAEVLAGLRAEGVDLRHVRALPQGTTGLAVIVVRDDGDKTILLVPGANVAEHPADADAAAHVVAAAPAGSVLSLDLEAPRAVVRAALRAARERGLAVVLDPSPADPLVDELFAFVDWLTPNPGEAEKLTGVAVADERSAARAGAALLARGVAAACMKLPEGGCLLVRPDRQDLVPAHPVRVVDKTGAGDAFAGALAVALRERQEPVDAVRFAVTASSLAVGAYGSQAAYPARARLDAALRERRG
jgi:ribokinase